LGIVPIYILCDNSLTRTMIDWINGALSILVASINVSNPGGLATIFALTVSADMGIPFPFALDTILFFTTYKMGAFSLPVLLVITTLLGGSLLGTSILYWVSRLLGTRFINWLGKRSNFLRRNLEQFQHRLGRWTIPVIVAARLTPGFMQVSSVAAGTARIHYYQVVLASVLSFIVYDGTLILRPEYTAWIVFGFVAIMAAVFVAIHLVRRRRKRSQHNDALLSRDKMPDS